MILNELAKYDPITIQCHDNPDADAIAAGYALCRYFEYLGKSVRLVYGGRNKIQKPNLLLMLEHLEIPLIYIENAGDFLKGEPEGKISGLLITVDCQYGSGNVMRLPAEKVAVIDHHRPETKDIELGEINSHVGSCATLVWRLLTEAGYQVEDKRLGTALYYGLFMDTNQFAELYNPLDQDMREAVLCDKSLITLFRNSNLSLQELEVAGVALLRYIYNDDYNYAIIKAKPCDPNILGLISDFLIQVAEVHSCVVYNETGDGYKFSVRSCIKEVQADELAGFLSEGVGSGGGHREKAGGFINLVLYEEAYPTLHSEAFFSERLNDYFDNCEIICAVNCDIHISDMDIYVKKPVTLGYVMAKDMLPVGTPITVRTLEGDLDIRVEEDLVIMVGIQGEVYPNRFSRFEKNYEVTQKPYREHGARLGAGLLYEPTIHNRETGEVMKLIDHAKLCISDGGRRVFAKELTNRVKVFTAWDSEKYMLGRPGDYLLVRYEDRKDIYILERDVFFHTYKREGNCSDLT